MDAIRKIRTDAPDSACIGVNGLGLQSFELKVFMMRLVISLELRVGYRFHGGVTSIFVVNVPLSRGGWGYTLN